MDDTDAVKKYRDLHSLVKILFPGSAVWIYPVQEYGQGSS